LHLAHGLSFRASRLDDFAAIIAAALALTLARRAMGANAKAFQLTAKIVAHHSGIMAGWPELAAAATG
jgi:hypothetical protein